MQLNVVVWGDVFLEQFLKFVLLFFYLHIRSVQVLILKTKPPVDYIHFPYK